MPSCVLLSLFRNILFQDEKIKQATAVATAEALHGKKSMEARVEAQVPQHNNAKALPAKHHQGAAAMGGPRTGVGHMS